MWGFKKTDYRGKIIEKLLKNNSIILVNDMSPTYIHIANGTLSYIDLTMCSPNLAQRLGGWLSSIYTAVIISQ